jgi:predicted nucleic acid-binding Zn ribbon protein
MPTYVYETIPVDPQDLVERFEIRQSFTEAPLASHPATGAPIRRVISGGLAVMPSGRAGDGPDPGPGCGPGSCGCGRFD